MSFAVTIAAVDYSSNVYDFELSKESLYYPGQFSVWIHDPDNTIRGAIERYDEVTITVGTLIFTGIAIDINKTVNNSRNIEVFGYDYSYLIKYAL